MNRVKISHRFVDHSYLRQTPGGRGEWEDYQFFINDNTDECDFWIVYEGISAAETCRCPSENTILFTGEPACIKTYPPAYLAQFGTVVTCQPDLKHPNLVLTQQALPWHVGMRMITRTGGPIVRSYDDFARNDLPPKSKLISMLCSHKEVTEGHRARRALAKRLAEHFGDRLDLYGKGSRYVEDKWDAMADYQYQVVVENGQYDHYWTEKLSDSYLAGAYPFYCGAANLAEYFPTIAFTKIDVHDPEGAIRIIELAIAQQAFERSTDALKTARDLVLNKYNLFPMIASIAQQIGTSRRSAESLMMQPEGYFLAKEFELANDAWAAEIGDVIPAGQSAILIDENCSLIPWRLPDRRFIPFLERDGKYAGIPADDTAAAEEFSRLSGTSAGYVVLVRDTFWWLDHYPGLSRKLHENHRCILQNDHLMIFDLRAGGR